VQLQQALPDLARRGIGVAAISYDQSTILRTFAEQRGITFPLLSDPGSATIKRYNILNTQATGSTAGIPHPGTFVVDPRGIVTARSFEERYQERASAASIVARSSQLTTEPGVQRSETAHLTLTTSASDRVAAPGTRVSLLLDIAPKARMHVYAPGQKELISISVTLKADEAFKAHAPEYPSAEKYFFEPLKETQLVYSRPFRVVQDVTIAVTPAMRDRARTADAAVTINGTLRYQACDDKVCYTPQALPVSWTIALKPLER
jgi:hypothetical protein